jgi:hypothetical protein
MEADWWQGAPWSPSRAGGDRHRAPGHPISGIGAALDQRRTSGATDGPPAGRPRERAMESTGGRMIEL